MLSCFRRAEATKKLRTREAANPKPQDCHADPHLGRHLSIQLAIDLRSPAVFEICGAQCLDFILVTLASG